MREEVHDSTKSPLKSYGAGATLVGSVIERQFVDTVLVLRACPGRKQPKLSGGEVQQESPSADPPGPPRGKLSSFL